MATKFKITLVLVDGREILYGVLNAIPARESIPFAIKELRSEPVEVP